MSECLKCLKWNDQATEVEGSKEATECREET